MLAIDREVKDAIESAERKNLILAFDDGTVIDNDDIAMESMELEQSISEEETLRFGGINSACFKVKVKGTTKEYKNLWFNATLNVGDYTLPLGRFLVNSDIATSDRQYREIVSYDGLYGAMNTDVSDWYNGLAFPISIYDMRNSLFEHLGIEQVETELINDDYMVDKTLEGNGIRGHRVLSSICELNAVFGVINAYGRFKYMQINNLVDSGLFPSETLYPSEDLYPQDIYDDFLSKADYKLGSLTYEEFSTQNITKVQIREIVNDIGVSVGEDGNTYAIEDNFLVYGDTIENLTVVAQNIFDYAKHLTYTPASLKCNGKPWREVGDMIQVFADDRVFHMPIMNRVLKGIQALVDAYSAKGREKYEEQQEVGYKADLKQIKRKTNILERTLDETRSEVSRVETSIKTDGRNYVLNSAVEKNGDALTRYTLSPSRNQMNGEDVMLSFDAKANSYSVSINIKRGSYTLTKSITVGTEFSRVSMNLSALNDYTEISEIVFIPLSGSKGLRIKNVKLEIAKGASTNWTYAPEDLPNKFGEYSTTEQMNSAITQSAEKITLEVSKTIENLQQQIDGAIETFSGSEEPTLNNYPANEWTTNEIKDSHIGDLYLVSSDNEELGGSYYRFEKSNGEYRWVLLKDNEIAEALAMAEEANRRAQELADDLANNYSTTIQMNSAINQKADSITLSVSKTYETKEDSKSKKESLQSQITQNADSIKLKVSANELIDEINNQIEVGTDAILISGNKLIIDSTNLKLDKDGNIVIAGKLTAQKGSKISTWETDENSLFSGKWGTTPTDLVFISTGTTGTVNIAGQNKSWVFGAAPYFGITKDGYVYANRGKVGIWDINEAYLEGKRDDGYIRLDPYRIVAQYKDDNGYRITKTVKWEDLLSLV